MKNLCTIPNCSNYKNEGSDYCERHGSEQISKGNDTLHLCAKCKKNEATVILQNNEVVCDSCFKLIRDNFTK